MTLRAKIGLALLAVIGLMLGLATSAQAATYVTSPDSTHRYCQSGWNDYGGTTAGGQPSEHCWAARADAVDDATSVGGIITVTVFQLGSADYSGQVLYLHTKPGLHCGDISANGDHPAIDQMPAGWNDKISSLIFNDGTCDDAVLYINTNYSNGGYVCQIGGVCRIGLPSGYDNEVSSLVVV